MKRNCVGLMIFVLGLICLTAAAALGVGDAVPPLSAQDQHGQTFTFTNGMRYLLIAREMTPAKAANRELSALGAEYLEKHRAAFLMDIHTMPAIARLFAFPKLRHYPHRIVLVDDPAALAWVPVRPGQNTLLELTRDGRIKSISYWNPAVAQVAPLLE